MSETHVLIVDDNTDNREYARQVLSSGWDVEIAINGSQALEQIRASRPALLLLDLSMPVLDGWELLRILKAEEATAEVPVVACTAHAMPGDRERALAAGFDAYLAKPYRPAELMECAEAFLGPGRDEDEEGWGGDGWSLNSGARESQG